MTIKEQTMQRRVKEGNQQQSEMAISYDQFFRLTTDAFHCFGSIFNLPVSEEPYAYLANVYRQEYPEGRVLDFGCGANRFLQSVLGISNDHYFTCDNDPMVPVTFCSLEEIPAHLTFQVISANQVLEHIAFADCISTVIALARLVAPGGILLLSVPNTQHPTRHLSNPTHLTPLKYTNLYALLTLAGLETIHCSRCNKTPGPRWYEWPFVNMISRIYRMDWCDTVYAVGKRL